MVSGFCLAQPVPGLTFGTILSVSKKTMEKFCPTIIWHWLYFSGFRVNKLVVNKVYFFPVNCI